MSDFLATLTVGDVVNASIGVLVVTGFLRGWIFTRAHYNDIVEQRNKWENAYWKEKQVSDLQESQKQELLETARTMRHFIEALPRAIVPEIEEKGS